MTFGKHRGKPIKSMDPGYLQWMLSKAKQADAWEGLVDFVEEHREDIEAALDPRELVKSIQVDYTLSPSQAAASKAIQEQLLTDPDTSAMRLEGGAGYGKSFTVLDVVRCAMHYGYRVHASATSYVATQVLCSHLEAYNIAPKTMASQLRLAKIEFEDQENYEVTENTYEQLGAILGAGNLFIVDEYSMVNDELGTLVLEAAARLGGKLLAVGDLKQLPPVKQIEDSVLAKIPASVTLTDPMRYERESDLFALEQLARHRPSSLSAERFQHRWNESTEVHIHDSLTSLTMRYVRDYQDDPSADARMLFFRRADVIEFNSLIRDALFGSQAAKQPIIEDEALMVTNTTDIVFTRDSNGKPIEKHRFYSGESYQVLSVKDTTHRRVPCYEVLLQGVAKPVPMMFGIGQVLDQETRGAEEYQKRLAALRDEAMELGQWSDWREFKNSFLPVSHRYATTVHRSQGATLDRVYFSISRLQAGPMTEKLLYVAATRARCAAHITL